MDNSPQAKILKSYRFLTPHERLENGETLSHARTSLLALILSFLHFAAFLTQAPRYVSFARDADPIICWRWPACRDWPSAQPDLVHKRLKRTPICQRIKTRRASRVPDNIHRPTTTKNLSYTRPPFPQPQSIIAHCSGFRQVLLQPSA
jgi:hypothetical protein